MKRKLEISAKNPKKIEQFDNVRGELLRKNVEKKSIIYFGGKKSIFFLSRQIYHMIDMSAGRQLGGNILSYLHISSLSIAIVNCQLPLQLPIINYHYNCQLPLSDSDSHMK